MTESRVAYKTVVNSEWKLRRLISTWSISEKKKEGKVNSNRTWEWLQIESIKKDMEGLLLAAQEKKKEKKNQKQMRLK